MDLRRFSSNRNTPHSETKRPPILPKGNLIMIMTYIEAIHSHAQLGVQGVIVDHKVTVHTVVVSQIKS